MSSYVPNNEYTVMGSMSFASDGSPSAASSGMASYGAAGEQHAVESTDGGANNMIYEKASTVGCVGGQTGGGMNKQYRGGNHMMKPGMMGGNHMMKPGMMGGNHMMKPGMMGGRKRRGKKSFRRLAYGKKPEDDMKIRSRSKKSKKRSYYKKSQSKSKRSKWFLF